MGYFTERKRQHTRRECSDRDVNFPCAYCRFAEAVDLETVAIKRIGERPVLLRDIARVVDGYKDRESYARMNGETALSIGVSKRTGANILEVVQAVKAQTVERAQLKSWPTGLTYRFLGDQSKMIDDMVSELENGIITVILVIGHLLFNGRT